MKNVFYRYAGTDTLQSRVTTFRGSKPGVWVDPDNKELIERIAVAAGYKSGPMATLLTTALRQIITEETTPEPDEPTCLGAVIDAFDGLHVLTYDRGKPCWYGPNGGRSWEELPRPIKVLHPGWKGESK